MVGWTDPEGRRAWLGALLLAYYDRDGRLVYAGRVGTGINTAELAANVAVITLVKKSVADIKAGDYVASTGSRAPTVR